jgi:Domain of unknown function (DUF4082)
MTSYRLYPSTNGPASSTAFGGTIIVGLSFEVTSDNIYMEGFWWWRADSSQSSAAQKFCLWQDQGNGVFPGILIPGTTVTSGTLALGWNYVPFPTPIPLTRGFSYRAQTGMTGNFPDTPGMFGTGGAYAGGITNGPLTAFSDQAANGGTNPEPLGNPQSAYATSTSDPTLAAASAGNGSFNCWLDVQVTDVVPANPVYRLWPNSGFGQPEGLTNDSEYVLATEFSVSRACKLDGIWHQSPIPNVGPATVLPSRCAIWDVNSQTVVPGTDNSSPTWSGAAGSGWVKCDYSSSGVILQPGTNYKVSTYSAGGTGSKWFTGATGYWTTGGGGAGGRQFGVLSAPDDAHASPGQMSWHGPGLGWAYPATSASQEINWVDVSVTPVASGSGLLMASFP